MLNAALTSERLVAITASGLPTETSLDCVCYHLLPHERNDHRHRDKGAHEPKLGAMVRAAQGEARGARQEQHRAQHEPRHPRGRLEAGEPGQQSAHACRATINVRIRDNQDERAFRLWRLREGGARPEAPEPESSAPTSCLGTGTVW